MTASAAILCPKDHYLSKLSHVSAEAPKFTRPLSDQVISVGEQIVLECSVFGIPQPSVEFFSAADSTKLQTGGRISVQHDETNTHWRVVIKQSTRDDLKEYRAVAKNTVGSAMSTASVTEKGTEKVSEEPKEPAKVSEEPKEERPREETTKAPEEPAEKTPQVAEQPQEQAAAEVAEEPAKQAAKVPEETREPSKVAEETTQPTKPSEEKPPETVAEEPKETTKPIEKDAKEKPTILQGLKRTVIKENQTVELIVKVAGVPAPEVDWYKDGNKLQPDGKRVELIRDSQAGQHTLVIRDAVSADAGEYSVKVHNEVGSVDSTGELVVETADTPPEFTEKLRDVEIREAETVEFAVTVTGHPEPDLKWAKDGQPITVDGQRVIEKIVGQHRRVLIIKDSKQSDAGKYSCTATNRAGTAETSGKLGVKEAVEVPKITEGLKSRQVKEAETAEMSVKVAGKPEPDVKWLKDGQPVEIDNVHIIEKKADDGTHTLIVKDATPADVGQYTCKAVNKAGEDESSAKFDVVESMHAPKFTEGLKPLEVKESESATMTVTVTGKPEPEVQWFKDGRPVNIDNQHVISKKGDAGHHSLSIKNATPSDADTYTCKAVNKAGSDETSAKFGVIETLEAPKFTEGLKPLEVKEGDNAVLRVTVQGKPQPEIQWLKDGRPVDVDGSHLIAKDEGNGKYTLAIKDADKTDAGTYTCKAVNKAGSDETSAKFGVEQAVSAPRFTQGLQPLEVKEGETAHMSVVVSGNPEPEVQWYKDGRPLRIDGSHVVSKKEDGGRHTLTIVNATDKDVGQYSCQAVNKIGVAQTAAKFGVIEAVEAPKFTDGLKPIEVKEGETATLSVAVEGKPEPQIQWMKDGQPVNIDNSHIVEKKGPNGERTLTIKDAKPSDVGQYTCKAVNKAGTDETSAKFGVVETLEAPKFTEGLKPLEVKEGENAELAVAVTGKPEPEVQWLKDGRPVNIDNQHVISKKHDDAHHSLAIKDASKADAGTYSCKAVNKAGTDETSANFGVVEDVAAPKFTEPLHELEVKPGETAKLECTVVGKPEPEVKWVRDGVPVNVDNQHVIVKKDQDGHQTLIIKDASTADAGRYSCEAANKAGKAETSAELKFPKYGFERTKEEEVKPYFIEPLEPKTVRQGEEVVLTCKVNEESHPEVQWFRDGKPVEKSPNVVVEHLDDGTLRLKILSATSQEVGTYKCEAVNPSGKAVTTADLKYAEQRAIEQPKEEPALLAFKRPLRDLSVKENTRAVFECQLEKGSVKPNVRIEWTKDDRQIPVNARVETYPDGIQRVIIETSKFDNVGRYRCTATDGTTSVWTEAQLNVFTGANAISKLSFACLMFFPFPFLKEVVNRDTSDAGFCYFLGFEGS